MPTITVIDKLYVLYIAQKLNQFVYGISLYFYISGITLLILYSNAIRLKT